jgi:type VI protein secretion system component Hcp
MQSQSMFAGILILIAAPLAHAGAITCSLNPTAQGTSGINTPASDVSGVFDADDFSFDIKNQLSEPEQSSATGAATPLNLIRITKKVDGLSSLIFEMAANGASFQSLKCTVNGAPSGFSAAPAAGLTATISDATVTAYKVAKTADEPPKETVTFNFTKIQVTYSK